MSSETLPPMYALVAYIRDSLGQFVEDLRAEVHPAQAHLAAHVSVLPPRPMSGTESESIEMLRKRCATFDSFEIELGDVESFVPTTPTVFIRVSYAAYRLRELHDALNVTPLGYTEPLVYMPHLTIAKLDTVEHAVEVHRIAQQRWHAYQGSRRTRVERLTFVRGRDFNWADVEDISLRPKP